MLPLYLNNQVCMHSQKDVKGTQSVFIRCHIYPNLNFLLSCVVSLLFLVNLVGCADSPPVATYVTVDGIGENVEQAKKNGLRNAIQLAFGNLVLSERKIINDKLFEDDASYARGVIDSFKIISTTLDKKDNLYRITMQVGVSESALEKRILLSQDTKNIDGVDIVNQIKVGQSQIASEIERALDASRLFEHITQDFAISVFDIKADQLKTVRKGASIFLTQDIRISINDKYYDAVCRAAKEYRITHPKHSRDQDMNGLDKLTFVRFSGGCFKTLVEPKYFEKIKKSVQNFGVCLNLVDTSGGNVTNLFYDAREVGILSINQGEDDYDHMLLYNSNGSNSSVKMFDFATNYTLKLPYLNESQLGRVKNLKARLSGREQCNNN